MLDGENILSLSISLIKYIRFFLERFLDYLDGTF